MRAKPTCMFEFLTFPVGHNGFLFSGLCADKEYRKNVDEGADKSSLAPT